MKATIIYKEKSDHRRQVQEFYDRLVSDKGDDEDIELLDANSREAQQMMRLYGLMEYPAIVVTAPGDGRAVQSWRGLPLPQASEVLYFVHS